MVMSQTLVRVGGGAGWGVRVIIRVGDRGSRVTPPRGEGASVWWQRRFMENDYSHFDKGQSRYYHYGRVLILGPCPCEWFVASHHGEYFCRFQLVVLRKKGQRKNTTALIQ